MSPCIITSCSTITRTTDTLHKCTKYSIILIYLYTISIICSSICISTENNRIVSSSNISSIHPKRNSKCRWISISSIKLIRCNTSTTTIIKINSTTITAIGITNNTSNITDRTSSSHSSTTTSRII